ncbi:MAG: hypothetical protein K0Q60_3196 [Microvirga sp.]|jgi:hypothetical protein|nr:hypothetical protein [Microvirga sp.]
MPSRFFHQLAASTALIMLGAGAVAQDQLYRSAEATTGKTVRLAVLTNVSRECTPGPLPEIRVTVPPKHGTLAIRRGRARAGALPRCPNLEPPLQGVFYQSQPRYIGPDRVSFEVERSNGQAQSITINITVAAQARPGAAPRDSETEL